MNQELNSQQKLAAEAPPGPLLIVAGAGTGKTKTLTSRLVYLIETGIEPRHICALTFTNKAAREMADRVSETIQRSGKASENVASFIGTFHSLGARILRVEAGALKRNGHFVIFDDHDSLALIKKSMKKMEIAKKDGEGPAFFARKISEIKNGVLEPRELKQSKTLADQTALRAFDRYEKALQENNAFDFDDLIGKVVELFGDNPVILEKYRKRFQHILVDEYQDVNPKQYELIRLLSQKHKNLSVVGDDHQMIYGWRYAKLETFLGFEDDWPGSTVVLLEENYRSTANIIGAASAVIQNNRRQKQKTLWTKNEPGSPIEIFETVDEDEEAELVAEKIKSAIVGHDSEEAGEKYPSTAILYRTNAQSRAIEQALIRRQIPYRIFGGLKFYERKEIKDIIAALRYASNSKDEVSRDRLEKNLSKKKFEETTGRLVTREGISPRDLVHVFLQSTDYLAYIEKNFTNAEERKENIAELISFASEFKDVETFLQEVSLLQTTDSPTQGERSALRPKGKKSEENKGKTPISLMTVHLSKGLEFDRVYLIGCSEGLLPHARSLNNESQLEEERRLMYVAMTRARKYLQISFYDIPSRFLSELPSETVNFKSSISHATHFSEDEERYITLD